MSRVSILGAGTWGLALSKVLHDNGSEITIWSAVEKEIDELESTHAQHNLPGFVLPDDVHLTKDLNEAVRDQDVLVLAVASPYTRRTARLLRDIVKDGQIIINVAKGIEEDSLLTLSEVIEEEIPQANVCVLSGPSHAEEVAIGLPTIVVIGSRKKETAEYLDGLFSNENFRVYTSPDVKAMELGGALKNVIALAAGMSAGLGYGDNATAALITRGIVEICRLGTAMGGNPFTFYGLTGIGDLIVTCASKHSRNRRAGVLMGQGMKYEEAMKEVNMIVEGVYSAKAALTLSQKYKICMPIVEEVNEVLFNDKPVSQAFSALMNRESKDEVGTIPWEKE